MVTLFLCGDVMLGRGIDQILPRPGDPTLMEAAVRDARRYVDLAERVNGRVPRPVDVLWPWGDALGVLEETAPAARIINLENAVTRSDDFAIGKAVHYRMHPDNLGCLSAARPDVCVLANNHVLDFGRSGLDETLEVLHGAELRTVGAGHHLDEAERPAVVPLVDGGRVLVFAVGMATSGIPAPWAAADAHPGVAFVQAPSRPAAADLLGRIQPHRRPDDVVVVSVHWGPNWGYQVARGEEEFAHALIDAGVDVVHGHSSHHPRPIEVYRDRLILYGCGDFVDDYEGIGGHETYRGDLRLMYLVTVEGGTGELAEARLVPMRARRMRLERAAGSDAEWLRDTLDGVSRRRGARIRLNRDGDLHVEPWSGG